MRIFNFLILLLTISVCLAFSDEKSQKEEKPIYTQNFEKIEEGDVPEDFFVLEGDFSVKQVEKNKQLELPGTPLSAFCILFGPRERDGIFVYARIKSERQKRLYPRFGVGLCGIAGYKLRVIPASRSIELMKDDKAVSKLKYKWESGTWTCFLLQVRKLNDKEWIVEGKVWPEEGKEPKEWMISFHEEEEPILGMASIWGTPYSSKPIQYDDLLIDKIGESRPEHK